MSLLIINHHYFRSKKLKQGIYPITPDELKIEIKKLNKYGWILGSQEKLFEKLIKVNRVTKVNKGGKKLAFRAFVIVGDQKGSVGLATAKSKEVPLIK